MSAAGLGLNASPLRVSGGASRKRTCRTLVTHAVTAAVQFSKYQGLGNDFILVDNRHQSDPVITPEQAVKICDRNFGVGGDGVILALPPSNDKDDYSMRIWNSDGSEPEMCGNGIRCLAKFVADRDGNGANGEHKVHTGAGLMQPRLLADGQVRVNMGPPILKAGDVPTTLPATQAGPFPFQEEAAVKAPLSVAGKEWLMTCVSMGNPHAVTFGTSDGESIKVGPFSADMPLNLSELPDEAPVSIRILHENARPKSMAVMQFHLDQSCTCMLVQRCNTARFECVCDLSKDMHTASHWWKYARSGRGVQVDAVDIRSIGPLFETNAVFPARANTEFVEVLSRDHVRMLVWERGAGQTLACGTGACAVVVAGVLEGRLDRKCRVDLPGGPLVIEWQEDNNVAMTGPAELSFTGSLQLR